MAKNTFENYEYPTAAESREDNTDEFFVVENEGTFLLNRQVQFVTQVEDVNGSLESNKGCTVYDVAPQQFFVDVADNPTELISVADNYILQTPVQGGESNFYGNNFYLQVVPAEENSEEDQSDKTLKLKDTLEEIDANIQGNKQNISKRTEISLTDNQFKDLEQKGWVLLENTDNKVYIFDAFGLHDITSNTDLIRQLRNNSELEIDPSRTIRADNLSPVFKVDNIYNTISPVPLESVNIETAEAAPEENFMNAAIKPDIADNEQELELPTRNDNSGSETEPSCGKDSVKKECMTEKEFVTEKKVKTLKIKTTLCFKDIPDKITLGKTCKGKRLVAKVVKRTPGKSTENMHLKKIDFLESQLAAEAPVNQIENQFSNDSDFEEILQLALDSDSGSNIEQVAVANEIVAQLSQVPMFQSCAKGRNIIITKMNDREIKSPGEMNVVTGIVTTAVDGKCHFTHVPDLLVRLMTDYIEYKNPIKRSSKSILKINAVEPPDLTILHVNVTDMKLDGDAIETISVVLNEKLVPCESLAVKRQASKLHACGACANVFATKMDLIKHQEVHIMEDDDTLTIDTDISEETSSPLTIKAFQKTTNKFTEYSCSQCLIKFKTLNSCLRHIRSHTYPSESTNEDKPSQSHKVKLPPLHKCKMCNCSYFYSSSLAKHISRVHLMDKVVRFLQHN